MLHSDIELQEIVYPSGTDLPRHAHPTAGFCLVLDGTYAERYGARSLNCGPRTVTFSPAGAEHRNVFTQAPSHCFTIDVAPSWIDRLGASSMVLADPMAVDGGTLAPIAERLLREWRHRDDSSPLIVEGLVLELIGNAARNARVPIEGKASAAIRRARELLEAHYVEAISLADVAMATGRHPVYVAAQFRRVYGETIGDFVRRLRVEHACRELARSERPLADVALVSGFANQSHFTRVFKRAIGMTPAAYRNLQRGPKP
ncbi:MAG TPA: AraC family transcriptional regulator [Thermoanaerobaculia bacterium]|nr:AraC family transcriptional regulator [Thermoanaerobaculia bacterium]